MRLGTLAACGLLAAVSGLSGCIKNAATGERILSFGTAASTRAQELKIGAEAAPQMTKEFGGAINNPRLQSYLTSIGRKIAATTEADNPTLPWEFTLLDSSVINAFALPGGKVFVSRGLIEKMTNEAQLAGVVGHEIGHVTAQHSIQRINQAQVATGVLTVAGAAASAAPENSRVGSAAQVLLPALNVGGQVVLLKFGRDEESQADYLGMRYMSKAGYNPQAQLQVMQILKAAGGGGGQLEILSTHPLPETRIHRVSALLAGEYAAAAKDPKNQFYDAKFQSECLAELKKMPPPTQQAEAESRRLLELAMAAEPRCVDRE